MFKVKPLIAIIVASFGLITACASQPESIIETVIIEVTSTPLPSEEPTDPHRFDGDNDGIGCES